MDMRQEKYKQIDFQESSVEGLSTTLAVLALSPKVLEKHLKIQFQQEQDDLDNMEVAVLKLSTGRVLALLHYAGLHESETHIRVYGNTNLLGIYVEILKTLDLRGQDIHWRHPNIRLKQRTTESGTATKTRIHTGVSKKAVHTVPEDKKLINPSKTTRSGRELSIYKSRRASTTIRAFAENEISGVEF